MPESLCLKIYLEAAYRIDEIDLSQLPKHKIECPWPALPTANFTG